MPYLLDTNIVIAFFAGEAGVRNSLATAEEVFLPSTAIGELNCGDGLCLLQPRFAFGVPPSGG